MKMVYRWECDRCGKGIINAKDRLKVCQTVFYEAVGDLCLDCWNEIKKKAVRA